jgi:hypothetical protein
MRISCVRFFRGEVLFVFRENSVTLNQNLYQKLHFLPISVAVRTKAQVCSSLIAGIADSNPAEGMDVRLLCSLCVL